MTSRERVLVAVEHRTPDRVPITFDAEPEVIARLMAHFGVESRDEVWDALHVDTRLVGADHRDPRVRDEANVRYDFWGIGEKKQAYSGGTYWEYCVHPLADMRTVGEVEGYAWPSPDETAFDTIREARRRNPDKAIIAHITHGGFFKATHLRGLEAFLMDLVETPELAQAIIRQVTAYLLPAVERLCKEAGASFDIFYMADDFCGTQGPLISPAMFRDLIQPYLADIADMVHAYGKKMLLHTCGSVRALLPDIIAAGVDMMEPVQTSAAGMDVEGLERDFGDRMAFYGSIDLIRVLTRGTPEDVRLEVLKNFRVLGRNGGLIIGPGHTYIQPDTPLENILALYETAWRECRYVEPRKQ